MDQSGVSNRTRGFRIGPEDLPWKVEKYLEGADEKTNDGGEREKGK